MNTRSSATSECLDCCGAGVCVRFGWFRAGATIHYGTVAGAAVEGAGGPFDRGTRPGAIIDPDSDARLDDRTSRDGSGSGAGAGSCGEEAEGKVVADPEPESDGRTWSDAIGSRRDSGRVHQGRRRPGRDDGSPHPIGGGMVRWRDDDVDRWLSGVLAVTVRGMRVLSRTSTTRLVGPAVSFCGRPRTS